MSTPLVIPPSAIKRLRLPSFQPGIVPGNSVTHFRIDIALFYRLGSKTQAPRRRAADFPAQSNSGAKTVRAAGIIFRKRERIFD